MGVQEVYTDDLVELYIMAKLYAEENGPLTKEQERAILGAETLIENNSGWKITMTFDPKWY